MQAEYYGNGIAVFGDTKTWKEDIKALGGQFRRNLNGRPGWIFGRNQETELMQFIANANAGVIQPTPAQQYTKPVPQTPLAPFGQTQPGMTPQAAMARLTVAQPPQVPRPPPIQPLAPRSPPVPQGVQPLVPQPVTTLPTQPTTVAFPNMFKAADGLTYKIVMYTVVVPEVGQKVVLDDFTGNEHTYVVTNVGDDVITITQDAQEVQEGTQPAVTELKLIGGTWQLPGKEGGITFLPLNQ